MQGLSGGQALNKIFEFGGEAGKYSSQVTQALTGTQKHDLAKLIAGIGPHRRRLRRQPGGLQGLIDNFNVFTGALANQSENLATTVRELAPTLKTAHTSLVSLDKSLPPLRTYAIELTPGGRRAARTDHASKPWLAQVRPLLSGKEGGGTAKLLAEATPGLAGAAQAGKRTDAAAAQPAQPLHLARCWSRPATRRSKTSSAPAARTTANSSTT